MNSLSDIDQGEGLISINSLVLGLTKLKPSFYCDSFIFYFFQSSLNQLGYSYSGCWRKIHYCKLLVVAVVVIIIISIYFVLGTEHEVSW